MAYPEERKKKAFNMYIREVLGTKKSGWIKQFTQKNLTNSIPGYQPAPLGGWHQ